MKKILLYLITGFIMSLAGVSCESALDVDPRQSIDSETALTSEEAINAAVNGVYARLREEEMYGRDLIAIPELLADNANNTGAGNRLVGQANNQPGAHIRTGTWQYCYYAINQANLIFQALEEFDADQDYKDGIAGQLYFLRALCYHTLMKAYAYDPTAVVQQVSQGGVPILTQGTLTVDEVEYPERASIEECYDFIYEDLTRAVSMLDDSGAPHYATSAAASALFSRVALYRGDYAKVVEEAENALESGVGSFQDHDQYINSWRVAEHPESLFEVVFTEPDNLGVNVSLRATFTTRMDAVSTSAVGHGNAVVSDDLYDDYDEDDIRRELIWPGLSAQNSSLHEMTKFLSKNGVNNLDNVPVIRIPEVILNMAEAYATPGSPVEDAGLANEHLNRIRERAGLEAANYSGEELYEEVLRQRRLELAFEGHRFFDLKRLGRNIVKEPTPIQFTDIRILAPIPVREVVPNTNVTQNNGY